MKSPRDKNEQAKLLEQLLPPKVFIKKLIQCFKSIHLVGKRVLVQAMNQLFLLMMLDMNSLFSYIQAVENQYYVEACNHYEVYINLLQRFARYHGYTKLVKLYEGDNENESSLMVIDTV